VKRKSGFFLVLIGVVTAGVGGWILNTKILVLQLQNTDHPHVLSIKIKPLERFSIYYVHSIHQQPVIEEFEAAPNMIILKGVRTKSLAIAEQYGWDDPKIFHPMNEKLGAIFFRVAEGEGQGLIVRDRKIYLSEIGARGDRIQLGVRSISVGSYLFRIFSEGFQI
jgi:hypothetical protein